MVKSSLLKAWYLPFLELFDHFRLNLIDPAAQLLRHDLLVDVLPLLVGADPEDLQVAHLVLVADHKVLLVSRHEPDVTGES